MKTYTTIQGDMWDSIAYKLYGDEKYMCQLMKSNLELLDMQPGIFRQSRNPFLIRMLRPGKLIRFRFL